MKRFMNNILTIVFIGSLFAAISCSNDTEEVSSKNETPVVVIEQGSATVRMFVPDYYALAEQGVSRAIAPQTTKARLSYSVNGSWVGINTVSLSDATKTLVENAPDGFTGSVYACTFSGVPVGTYNAGNLQIELMDASGNAITSGTNATSATIAKGGNASTTFYTVPLSTGANTGNLASGEMKFSRAALVAGVEYPVAITSSGDYPDLVLFSSDGKLSKYYAIDTESEASVTLTVDKTDVYYLGLWADDGKDIARYTLAFDFGSGTQVNGKLGTNMLHWTKENSPYIVTGDTQVKEGTELTIDAGVIVQFTGNYYLSVRGVINAQGTKENPIVFVQSGDNLSNWNGISVDSNVGLSIADKYTYSSGNILKNCMIIGANNPLTLKTGTYIDSCTVTGSGSVNVKHDSLLINNIFDNGLYVSGSSLIINNDIKSSIDISWDSPTFKNNTITNAGVQPCGGSSFTANTFNSCIFGLYNGFDGKITGNNFLGYTGIILSVSTSADSCKTFNYTGNYWGEEQTSELAEKGANSNLSFIYDGNDNLDLTEIDYSNWATEPIEGAGYLGDGFIAFDYTINGYNYDNGGYYPENTSPELSIAIVPQYHANSIASVRIAQSLSALKETAWSSYSANKTFTVDKTALTNGVATIYVQLKDSEGNLSSPLMHEVPFDSPVVTLSIEDGTSYSAATSSVTLNYGATDNGNLTQYELYLDSEKVSTSEESYGWGRSCSNSYVLGLAYMPAGNHSLKLTFWDSARNSTTKEVAFTINRTVDTRAFAGTTFDTTSGQLLKDSNTVYLWHFDGDGTEAGGDENARIYLSTESGGLNGYASYSSTSGSISLPLENAFTVECWRKGNNFNIQKSDVFSLDSTYAYVYYTTASGSTSLNSFGWNSISDNDWHFYSFVYNGSYIAIYRDGVLLHYQDVLSQTLNTNDNKLYISAYNIDELRISKVARSADEIAAYYNAAKDKLE